MQSSAQYNEIQENRGNSIQFKVDVKNYVQFYENDGLRCCIFALKKYIQYLTSANTSSNSISIIDQMVIKTLINIIYTTLYQYKSILYYKTGACNCKKQDISQHVSKFKQLLKQLQIDDLLIKIVTLTLQVYWLPIKKLVMLYTRVLIILFHNQTQNAASNTNLREVEQDRQQQGGHLESGEYRQQLYKDSTILKYCQLNQLSQNYLKQFREQNKPQQIKTKSKLSPIQNFYAKYNVGDCPLAQSIVVGLLRSLLTICNSQAHRKFQVNPAKGSGADSYREWQISYQFIICLSLNTNVQGIKDYKQYLTDNSLKLLRDYTQYNQNSGQTSQNSNNNISNIPIVPTHFQFYKHKIYTTSAIATFFTFLLAKFRSNAMIQFTYLYQLISDANGILVFLKFLTDKFQYLQPISQQFTAEYIDTIKQIYKLAKQQKIKQNVSLKFKDQVMLTVYSVLLVLYGACNNYTQKTRSYLFEYNSYLIIKKIPHIFMKVHKNDEELPSEEQIQAQFGRSNTITSKKVQELPSYQIVMTNKVKELTFLCYSLLKIQIPFFSKKMKQNTNNMKMIVQIYCQMPKKIEPIKRTQLDKLILKNQMRKIQHQKYILSVEQLKGIHNQYNNLYYWSNQQAKINEANEKNEEIVEKPLNMTEQEVDAWLEENVWRFYD